MGKRYCGQPRDLHLTYSVSVFALCYSNVAHLLWWSEISCSKQKATGFKAAAEQFLIKTSSLADDNE